EEIVESFGPRRGERQRLVLHAAKAVCDRGKKREMGPQRSGEKWQRAGVFLQERANGNGCGRGVGLPGLGRERQLSAGNLFLLIEERGQLHAIELAKSSEIRLTGEPVNTYKAERCS